MNRTLPSIFSFVIAASAVAQPAAPRAVAANMVTESSRVARFVAGPQDRPYGVLLRNGTFVILPPALAQRVPAAIGKHTPFQATGQEFIYQGSKTIQAHDVRVAGVSYAEDSAIAVNPASPPPPGGPEAAPPCPPASAGRMGSPPPPSASRGVIPGPASCRGAALGPAVGAASLAPAPPPATPQAAGNDAVLPNSPPAALPVVPPSR